jgi:Fe-S oxidoreductase
MDSITELRRTTGAAYCLDCGKCTARCPLSAEGTFSPRLIAMQEIERVAQGKDAGVGRCLTCGSCETRCPQAVKFIEYVRGFREHVPDDVREVCPHKGVFQSLARSMVDSTPQRNLDWLGDDLKVAEEGETALFVGCLPFFDLYFGSSLAVQTLDIARSAVRILNQLGIEPVILTEERCCGHDLLWDGDQESFKALAKANTEAYASRGVKHILTTCAECCRSWKIDYPEHAPGYNPKVEHLSEFLAARVEAGDLAFKANGDQTLTFQDPCRLARHVGVTDQPRTVLGALPGKQLVEMQRSGEDALCCGTSGFMHCDATSKDIQAERLEEARATGAETLVTACPKCLIHFTCAQSEDRRRDGVEPKIQVTDFTVLAASMLDGEASKAEDGPADSERDTGDAQ